MRIYRFLFAALFTVNALTPVVRSNELQIGSNEMQPGEFIVNQQVISDVAVGDATASCPGNVNAGDATGSSGSQGEQLSSSDLTGGAISTGDLTAGSIGTSGVTDRGIGNGALAGRLASGRVAGRIAGAASYVGDLARGTRPGEAGCVPRTYGYPDLFYNFYTQGNCNQTNAQMYVAPVPVPPNVGHTFYTYQPFMPHEMLYWHTDRFHNYYDGGRGMNHTKVHYYAPPVKQAASNLYWNYLRIPR